MGQKGFEDVVEDVEKYVQGGLHPIHLGDVLDERFEVVYKLGHGAYATVWLCYDVKEKHWRAVKVLAARHSTPLSPEMKLIAYLKTRNFNVKEVEKSHIIYPYEYFWLAGPNGRHVCFVLPVLGPSIEHKINEPASHKKILFQLTEGLHFLHRKGLCHGDFRPQNLLLRLDNLDNISKEEMKKRFDQPLTEEIKTLSGNHPGPRAPEYLVAPTNLDSLGVTDDVAIVDLGEYFRTTEIPRHGQVSITYAAPETLFKCGSGPASDIWALGSTIAEVRAGRNLFGVGMFGGGEESYVRDLEYFFGPLPEPYRGIWEKRQRAVLGDNAITSGNPTGDAYSSISGTLPATYQERIEAVLSKEKEWFNFITDVNGKQIVDAKPVRLSHRIPEGEVAALGDLLRKMLRYDPDKRLDTSGILSHEWF
ncbi:kinase-like domain-containing protein, partial [Xylariales sp. AK1849]